MPWKVTQTDRCPASKPWGVVGGSTGDRLAGCHPTQDAARKQQAALYVHESKGELADDQSQALDVDGVHYPVYKQAFSTPITLAP
jgi:hypothetical protein